MSYLDILPVELQETINVYKYELETRNLQAFVDDFDMKVISIIKANESRDCYSMNHTLRYKCKMHLTYKPSCKSIIIPYSYGVSTSNLIKLPSKYDVVQSLSFDAYWFCEGDWTYVRRNIEGGWYRDFSYNNYVQQGEGTPMSYKRFIFWKNSVKKMKVMFGNRFGRFMQCYSEEA